MSTFGSGICQNVSTTALGMNPKPRLAFGVATINPRPRPSSALVVRAEGQTINPEIRKTEEKVVDSVVVSELSKPLTPYCRCWRSGTFPLCDGSHVKHNKATGDNVGPLLLKKQ
ncbi:CDGSH iron-sulfur domain-containing protein 2A [Hibiscus syriacus]|uniref:CDGSH iron-sulfur domain-containing protein 2A n=1 Tax=Hibiscus syriacus TaxID=106335 RepID=A0A6A2ZR57_HIBSY|nr:CDGSH iron-sulfur domain-containing protein NEET [Hibiscus syriacus]KAE8694240.1 CDGSH iron-sulfur domain-containing protein 2A [Hibiscus syriacus]